MSNINAGDMVLIVAGCGVGRSGIVEGCIPPGGSERIYAHDNSYDVTATNTGDSPVFVVSAPGFSTTFKSGEKLRGFLLKERHEILKISGHDDESIFDDCDVNCGEPA
ncbi:hypothetical protein ACQYE4_000685 [Enterobacter bugandensis]